MPVSLFLFCLLLLCLSEGELLGALFSYIILGGGGSLSDKGFVLPPCLQGCCIRCRLVTELAGVLCVVLVSLIYLQELAGVLCVVPYCLCCLEHARVPCVVLFCF